MRQADALTKEYLSNNEIFADVFNYLIYDGQQRILPENLIERDTSEITLPLGKRGELATIQKFRDILKGCIAKEYKNTLYVLFGVENQSHIHYAMPVRNMLYDAIACANGGLEIYLGKNWSIDAYWMYAWWKSDRVHNYWRTYGGDVELRKWLGSAAKRKPLTGHHIGA